MSRIARRGLWLALALTWLLGLPATGQAAHQVLVLRANGPLTPAMADYLDRGLGLAGRQGAEAVLLVLDTPGGSVDLMNRMVQSIRGSAIPVVVYVAPRGAIAGSAGTVIALAGHVVAMAPETAIGAASPVGGQGEDLGQTMEAKIKGILKAEVRTLAFQRGAAAIAMAESTIDNATAVSSQEALQAGLIDFVATDNQDLLRKLNGFSVIMPAGSRSLNTQEAELVEVGPTYAEQLLALLTNPNVVLVLLAVGVQALIIELWNPGGWVAGFIGVSCLALSAYGLGILDVNWFGLIFLVISFAMFVLDIKAPTHGALTLAGVASFIIGALVLFNSPGTPTVQRVSVPLVVGVGLATAAGFFVILTFALRAQRRPLTTGTALLIGRIGETRSALAPSGMVQVAGELWSADIAGGQGELPSGATVEVVGVQGLRLQVRPAEKPPG